MAYPTKQTQILDTANTKDYTNSSAQFVGTFTPTRSEGIVRQLTVLASNVPSGLGGTFVFEYSEDGVTSTISETRTITDFATVRDFDLLNSGQFYRVKFTPSRAVTASEHVFITTTQRNLNDGEFVRLATQSTEEGNAALPQTFAYLRGFMASGKSVGIKVSDNGELNNIIAPSSFRNINTVGTTTIKTGSGILRRIVCNNPNVLASTLTVFDNIAASGTKIATINVLTTVLKPFTLEYNAKFSTGLTVVQVGTNDFTFIYE